MSETGLEVSVHRTLLGLYTEQWRRNLQGLGSSELVFILQGVGHQELEQLVNDIYKPLFVTEDDCDGIEGKDVGDKEDADEEVEITEVEVEVDENIKEIDIRKEVKNLKETSELKGSEGIDVNVDSKYNDLDDHTGGVIVTEKQEIFQTSLSQNDLFQEESQEYAGLKCKRRD